MIFKLFSIFAILVVLLSGSQAKIYSKCEFARTMKNNGVPFRQLGTWTCIASHESNFNTKAINDKTWDYGILQISSIYWCSDTAQPGKQCNITCKSLLGDDITIDIKCAKKIFAEFQRREGDGFRAWTTYKFCRGDQSSWIQGCGLSDL